MKHSEAKSLCVAISKNDSNFVSFEVKDDGKGMNEISNEKGYGLKNMEDRVKDLNGTISITSDETGTKIRFTIPV